ncbi:MAG: trimethylamine methyltransferase family protein [Alphaproteobacteria bacterium]
MARAAATADKDRSGGRRRSGGAQGRRHLRQTFRQEFLSNISPVIPLYDLASDETLELIEANAETVLQEVGVEFRDDPEAVEIWRAAGADTDGERVRFPRGLVRGLITRTAPRQFVQRARNPQRNVTFGGRNTIFAPVYGPPFIRNLDEGRRYANMEDFRNFVKLTYMTPYMHHSGGTVCEPVDVPVNKRHLDMVYAHIRLSDKPFMGSVTAPERAADTIAMCEILFGADVVRDNPVVLGLINLNSPLVLDATMMGALKVYARAGQPTLVTPFILAGAMAPVTAVGTLTQTLAEAMVGMAFTQLLNPGVATVFGVFASSMSMQSGAPTFGTPEASMVILAAGQLARRLGVPFRSGGALCASKISDAQAAYESAQTMWPAMLAGTNFVLHGAGWLEGGLAAGYEKFIMDADQLGMMHVLARGFDTSANGQAMDAIREVGPGKHFLGCKHTQDNFESAFYRSNVADNNSFEQWQADGSLDSTQRANAIWKQMLKDYEKPPMDPAIDEALQAFIAKRKGAMPDAFV